MKDAFELFLALAIIVSLILGLAAVTIAFTDSGSQSVRQHIVNQCTERGGVMVDTWLGYSRHNVNENELRIGDYVCLKLERIKK